MGLHLQRLRQPSSRLGYKSLIHVRFQRQYLAGACRPLPCCLALSSRAALRGRRTIQPSAQSTYSGATSIARQANHEEDDYGGQSRELHYPPNGPFVDEYDDSNDMGFWRLGIEDQAAFICNELDLSDEQALYLLHALGLLPEGLTLQDFRIDEQQYQHQQEGPQGAVAAPQLERQPEDVAFRDALESWQANSDDDEEALAGGSNSNNGAQAASYPHPHVAGDRVPLAYHPEESYSGHENHNHHDNRHTYEQHGWDEQQRSGDLHHPHHHPDEHRHEDGGDGSEDRRHEASSLSKTGYGTAQMKPGAAFQVSIKPNLNDSKLPGPKVAPGVPAMAYDQTSFDRDFEVIQLRVVGRRASTAAAMGDEIELTQGKLIAGRYQILEQVGAAAFSRAVQAYDTLERRLVCLKVVKNDKECMDACLEEVRLLQMVNARDPHDQHHIARLYDYFYHMGHLFLVVELLGGNLFDTQCYDPSYFTAGRMQSIAKQVLRGLSFLHTNHIIHADVKPENILVKNYSKCSVKLIDLGCSIYNSEAHTSHYVQSRSYRAPEVMLGLPYDGRIDVWSLGCVMAELATGQVLFPNVSEAAMMARMVGMLGDLPPNMLADGQYTGAFFTRSGRVYERNAETGLFELLVPKRTTLQARVPTPDRGLLHFIRHLLVPDPEKRPTAAQALKHPWLQYRYRSPK